MTVPGPEGLASQTERKKPDSTEIELLEASLFLYPLEALTNERTFEFDLNHLLCTTHTFTVTPNVVRLNLCSKYLGAIGHEKTLRHTFRGTLNINDMSNDTSVTSVLTCTHYELHQILFVSNLIFILRKSAFAGPLGARIVFWRNVYALRLHVLHPNQRPGLTVVPRSVLRRRLTPSRNLQ